MHHTSGGGGGWGGALGDDKTDIDDILLLDLSGF